MTLANRTPIESVLAAAVADPTRHDAHNELIQRSDEAFAALAQHLRADSSIAVLEQFENILKILLRHQLASPLSGSQMRALALFQKELGFLLKYKSYAIKASSPLGYSIFLENQGEGFSFQRHVTHKTEIFYILDTLPGGFIFLCDFKDWDRIYQRDSFLAWLDGEPNERYEQFRYRPRRGDVIVIDKLNVVHTVIGCVLAEFATISIDMVDRLHDQNEDRPIPSKFSRVYAEERLKNLEWPDVSHRVSTGPTGAIRTALPSRPETGGDRTVFGDGLVAASAIRCRSGSVTGLRTDTKRVTCLHIGEGAGHLVLGDVEEAGRLSPPTLAASAGDVFLIAPGAHYGFVNDITSPLLVLEHRIPPLTAFV